MATIKFTHVKTCKSRRYALKVGYYVQEIKQKIYTTPYLSHTYVMAVRHGFNLILNL